MKLLSTIIKKSERIDYALNYCGMLFTFLLMIVTAVNVIGRQFFNSPLQGYIDAEEMLMALLVYLSMPYCQLKEGNIRFELFMARVLKQGRLYHSVEALYLLFALAGFALIAFYTTETALDAYTAHDVTSTTHWPIWPAKIGVAIGCIFLCIRLVIQGVQSITVALAGKKVAKERWLE
jgi:TRAP-type C4-dicarboxylate transport system permease small subunit